MYLLIWTLLISTVVASHVSGSRCSDRPEIYVHKRGSVKKLDSSEPFVLLEDVSKEFLSCRSYRNIQWSYEGQGEPSKVQEEARVDINSNEDEESLEYCMSSRISFYHKQSDTDLAKHTGKYTCQEVGEGNGNSLPSNTTKTSAYVYIRRRNAPIFLHSRRTFTLPLSNENLTAASTFTIPCVTSTPYASAMLLKRKSDSAEYERISDNEGSGIRFDTRYGFLVNTSLSQELSKHYGEYKCVSRKSSSQRKQDNEGELEFDEQETSPLTQPPSSNGAGDFVIYSIVKPPTFRAYPPERDVFTSGMLNLTCESSEEPVAMKEIRLKPSSVGLNDYLYDEGGDSDGSDSNEQNDDIEELVETTENKLHVANYLELSPATGSFGEFQCVSEKDRRVLHTWRYRILGKKEEKLTGIKFNKRDNSFSCKTKSGVGGRLSFVSCRTPTECQINRICLQRSEGCRGYSNATKALCHRGNRFCGKIFYKGGSGLIRCVGDGIDQIKAFTDEANDQKLRMGYHKLKPSETALLTLSGSSKGRKEFLEGDELNANLKLGHYFFVYPVQWALQLRNGSTQYVHPTWEEVHKSKLHRNVEMKVLLPMTRSTSEPSEIIGLNALIPLRASLQPSWKTITLPLTIAGNMPGPSASQVSIPTGPMISEKSVEVVEDADGNYTVDGGDSNEPSPTGRSDIEFSEVTEIYNDPIVIESTNNTNTEDTEIEAVTLHNDLLQDAEATTLTSS